MVNLTFAEMIPEDWVKIDLQLIKKLASTILVLKLGQMEFKNSENDQKETMSKNYRIISEADW